MTGLKQWGMTALALAFRVVFWRVSRGGIIEGGWEGGGRLGVVRVVVVRARRSRRGAEREVDRLLSIVFDGLLWNDWIIATMEKEGEWHFYDVCFE